jgi:cobalt-precorrin 5A hydrolase
MKVAGFGFRAAASMADLQEALLLTGVRPDALASVAAKAGALALSDLAGALNLPVISLSEKEISDETTLTASPRIKARFGTGSLAEAAALAGVRRGSGTRTVRLICKRVQTTNGMATAAIAERTSK